MISVGIDVSKDKSTLCFLSSNGKTIVSPYEINHTEEEMLELVLRLKSLNDDFRVVLEATGAYHLPVLLYLKSHGIFVSVINPFLMKKYSAATLRKGKSDKMDAVKIASYGIDNWFRLKDYCCSHVTYEELRFMGRQYSQYIKLRINCKLNLTNLLDRTMPQIKTLLKWEQPGMLSKSKLSDFVEKYWHYDNITNMSESEFVADYQQWAKNKGYQGTVVKAKAIYQQALKSIPTLSSSSTPTKMMILESIRLLREINKTLEMILSEMEKISTDLPEYSVIISMPGVGRVLGLRMVAEIGDIKKFHSSKALVAYAGIDSPPYQSGKFNGIGASISKRGSSLLRKTGYEIMQCIKAIKPKIDDAVYQFMLKKEREGKAKKVAKIAALNKFLRIYYTRVKIIYGLT